MIPPGQNFQSIEEGAVDTSGMAASLMSQRQMFERPQMPRRQDDNEEPAYRREIIAIYNHEEMYPGWAEEHTISRESIDQFQNMPAQELESNDYYTSNEERKKEVHSLGQPNRTLRSPGLRHQGDCGLKTNSNSMSANGDTISLDYNKRNENSNWHLESTRPSAFGGVHTAWFEPVRKIIPSSDSAELSSSSGVCLPSHEEERHQSPAPLQRMSVYSEQSGGHYRLSKSPTMQIQAPEILECQKPKRKSRQARKAENLCSNQKFQYF